MTAIVVPVFNQWHYTEGCLASLAKTLPAEAKIVLVNNGSSDSTTEQLKKFPHLHLIHNETNLGCAPAWNQGVKALAAEWTVVLNNDVVLGPGWLENLLAFAEKNQADVISPGIREGDLNYEFETYARDYMGKMKEAVRWDVATGICFLVRRRVFEKIGYFDEGFRIGQFEDTDFFLRAKKGGFKLATTGAAFIHHYGSVTQEAMQKTKSPRPYAAENRAYFRRKWKIGPLQRFWTRWSTKAFHKRACQQERRRYGHSLLEKWIGGELRYF